jgi:tricorn protease
MRQIALSCLFLALVSQGPSQEPNAGYYRFPAIHGQSIVFTAEGDLWSVGVDGGTAGRLTTNPGQETRAAFSADGATIAFSASYEGPTEV